MLDGKNFKYNCTQKYNVVIIIKEQTKALWEALYRVQVLIFDKF